jgi:quercetin dioxygenase-like cupin family protein
MFNTPTIKTTKIILPILATLLLFPAEAVLAQDKPGPNRTVLLENRLELPRNNINTKVIRVSFPVGFKTPWHTHEGPGARYVVKGKLRVIEGGQPHTYTIGDVFWESGSLMLVENIGEDPAEIIIFELVSAN